MIRQSPVRLIMILMAILVVGLVGFGLALADTPPTAVTSIETNLRTGPGRQFDTIIVLPTGTQVILEARSNDETWLLVHTTDNKSRGWAARKLLNYSADIRIHGLPVSAATVDKPAIAPSAIPQTGGTADASGSLTPTWPFTPFPPLNTSANYNGPVVPEIPPSMAAHLRDIYAKGQALGNNGRVFVKVGDCLTYRWIFLNVFGYGTYDLGKYSALQNVINYFSVPVRPGVPNSFVTDSQAAANGFNSSAVLDPEWANPQVCKKDEGPLFCEYRLNKPSYAVIMYGTADVLVMTLDQFSLFMHEIIDDTIRAGIIPILSTFPENPSAQAASHLINQEIFQIGREENIPVMNLEAALQPLPNHGLIEDGIHLSIPPGDKTGYFTDTNLQYGYTMRNLVVLQALDAVSKAVR